MRSDSDIGAESTHSFGRNCKIQFYSFHRNRIRAETEFMANFGAETETEIRSNSSNRCEECGSYAESSSVDDSCHVAVAAAANNTFVVQPLGTVELQAKQSTHPVELPRLSKAV